MRNEKQCALDVNADVKIATAAVGEVLRFHFKGFCCFSPLYKLQFVREYSRDRRGSWMVSAPAVADPWVLWLFTSRNLQT